MAPANENISMKGVLAIAAVGAVIYFSVDHFRSPYRGSATSLSVTADRPWRFVVSGDSRNCGNIVMPAIAKGAQSEEARFFWHLGDFRALYKVDEDFANDPVHARQEISLEYYRAKAWDDFIKNQLASFGVMPVFLSIGNHETVDRTRAEYVSTFAPWLDSAPLHKVRVEDGDGEKPQPYFHWTLGSIDFISMDNATSDQFDAAQMQWFQKTISKDEINPQITTIVLGMHEALPDSLSFGHSMSEPRESAHPALAENGLPVSVDSGRRVYKELQRAQNISKKKVYILASHSHYYMARIFNTPYWKNNGGELPGWIVGTAGAERNFLPERPKDTEALEKTYGYLLATVEPADGSIAFEFEELKKADIPDEVSQKYGSEVVDFCFEKNMKEKKAKKVSVD